MNTLKLTLHKKAFEVMVTGEKQIEYRQPSKWIKSRLIDREYAFVEFTNGYGKDKPRFTAKYKGYINNIAPHTMQYSNGLEVQVKADDFIITLGEIVKIENYIIP